jgi:hypothetical protein
LESLKGRDYFRPRRRWVIVLRCIVEIGSGLDISGSGQVKDFCGQYGKFGFCKRPGIL